MTTHMTTTTTTTTPTTSRARDEAPDRLLLVRRRGQVADAMEGRPVRRLPVGCGETPDQLRRPLGDGDDDPRHALARGVVQGRHAVRVALGPRLEGRVRRDLERVLLAALQDGPEERVGTPSLL